MSRSGADAPLIVTSMSGNTNPFDPANIVVASFDGTLALAGYARASHSRAFAAMAAILLHGASLGRRHGRRQDGGQIASGFGDNLNLIGPKMNIPDLKPGFSLAIPNTTAASLNVGQNRWYGRIGFPIVWQLGAWVPGHRTTLEFLPAVWLLSNTDFVGQTMETDAAVVTRCGLVATAARRASTTSRARTGLTLSY